VSYLLEISVLYDLVLCILTRNNYTLQCFSDDDDDRSSDSGDDFAITNRQKDMERRRKEETILAANEGRCLK
jgi:hypothetical protein